MSSLYGSELTKSIYDHILVFLNKSAILMSMNPEERSLLERTYKLAEENNEILKSIRLSNRVSLAMRIIYWVVIIGISFGAIYFIQPYVNFLSSTISGSKETNIKPEESLQLLQDLLK